VYKQTNAENPSKVKYIYFKNALFMILLGSETFLLLREYITLLKPLMIPASLDHNLLYPAVGLT